MPTCLRLPAMILSAWLLLSANPLWADSTLSRADARLLLTRTGFTATVADVKAFTGLSRQAAASRLLDGIRTTPLTPPPTWVDDPLPERGAMRDASDDDKRMMRSERRDENVELQAWWYQEMLDTPSPLTEKLTLMWHNQFPSSFEKVRLPQLLYQQNLLFRRNAAGNFGTLLHQITRDPAMLIYLDGVQNHVGQANENYAREVMELFTLGEGHYSEQDVREAARAFTGWTLDRDSGQAQFRPRRHDNGDKTVFGHSGNFNSDDLCDLLLARPETATHVVTRVWHTFVATEADPATIARLAQLLRDQHYEMRPLLRAIFTSDDFYQQQGSLVKSPVELIVGTLRQFVWPMDDWRPVLGAAREMGQALFNPPNVKGWPEGTAWIDSRTLIMRKQFLQRIADVADHGQLDTMGHPDTPLASRWLAALGDVPAQDLLLWRSPLNPRALSATDAVQSLLLDPVYETE